MRIRGLDPRVHFDPEVWVVVCVLEGRDSRGAPVHGRIVDSLGHGRVVARAVQVDAVEDFIDLRLPCRCRGGLGARRAVTHHDWISCAVLARWDTQPALVLRRILELRVTVEAIGRGRLATEDELSQPGGVRRPHLDARIEVGDEVRIGGGEITRREARHLAIVSLGEGERVRG